MLRGSKGPVIQIDRLIFDTRNKTKKTDSIIQDKSLSSSLLNKQRISCESYLFIPSNKLKITRLTLQDLNKDQIKIYSMNQQPSSIKIERTIKDKVEDIISPIYESIDERQNSIDLIKKEIQFERLI